MIQILDSRFELILSKFSDGTQKVEINQLRLDCPDKDLTIAWRFEDESEILTLYFIVNWFRDHFSWVVLSLELYYVPYARMDRVVEDSDVFTLKYFTNLINSMKFEKVYILDPHSRVAPALIDRVEVIELDFLIHNVLEDIKSSNPGVSLTVLFPDRGAYERYLSPSLREHLEKFGGVSQILYGEKVRDWKTSSIQKFSINTRGLHNIQDVLIIDDIITSGGTIEECIKAIDDINATGKIYIYTTFLEKNAFKSQKFSWVLGQCEKIYTSNVLPLGEYATCEKLKIMDV